jgi:nicotinate-nucleotide adenylyltransferase
MKVGLYGGSFNPAHAGHSHVARTALRRLGLDRVIWLVAPRNPLKAAGETADLAERLAGAARRARGPRMRVSDIEARIGDARMGEARTGARYTIDTVRWLIARFPGVRFVWIMGADSLAGFHRWRGWADLARALPIAVVSRPGVPAASRFSPLARRFAGSRRPAQAARILAAETPPAWTWLAAPYSFASSTALRNCRLT